MNKLPIFLNHFDLVREVEFLLDFLPLGLGYLDLFEASLDGTICGSELMRLVTIEVR